MEHLTNKQINSLYDKETKKYIIFMCKKCKFYNGSCVKKRLVRDCAKKGLKNID